MPQIIKSDGKREVFADHKLRAGIQRALEKRPVDAENVESAIHRIQHKMLTSGEREISSRQIGEWVMQELTDLDQVAYVRFASVYRSFQDVDEFKDEVSRLQNQPDTALKKRQMSLLSGNDDDD